MADTTFVNYQTPIQAEWLNDVNRLTYDLPSTASGKGAALVGFSQTGTGAVGRTTQDKLRDTASVKDFGAKGDGTTDDTAAITAAIAAFPNQGSPNWKPWVLVFPPGRYLVSNTISIKNQQGSTVFGYGAELYGNFNGTVLQIGDTSGVNDVLWAEFKGLTVTQANTGLSANGISAQHCYSCHFEDLFSSGGRYPFALDGNANLVEMCTFRGALTANAIAAGGGNNEVNTFKVCAFENSAGYGLDLQVNAGTGGFTHIEGCYFEANALGNVRAKNTQKFTIRGNYFNMQNGASGVILDGTVGATYPAGLGLVEENRIYGAPSGSSKFIEETSTVSINCRYKGNEVESGICDLYGSAPKSVNLERVKKYSSIVNGTSIINTDSTGAPDGWVLGGSGNVGQVTSVSPYVNGSAASITLTNSYIYQQVNVRANSLIRVSIWARCSGALASAELQLWSVGLGSMYTKVVTTSTTASKLEIYLTANARSSATSFLIMLRNFGSGDAAEFCDIEIEDMTV